MALKFIDGFDHYETAQLTNKWDAAIGCTLSSSFGRLGSRGVKFDTGFGITGQGALSKNLPAANSSFGFFGNAFQIPVMPGAGYMNVHAVYTPTSGSAMHICSMIGSDGSVAIGYCTINNFSFSTTVLASSAPGLVAAGAWRSFETKFKIANSDGSVVCRLDGAIVVSFTGDTCGRGDGSGAGITQATSQDFTNVKVGGRLDAPSGNFMFIDDFWYCDDTGAINNNFLGDMRIQTIYSDGLGDAGDWARTGAASDILAVNEHPTINDASYLSASTVGHKFLHNLDGLSPAPGTIAGVAVNHRVYKDDGGARQLKALVKTGSTIGNGTTYTTPSGATNIQSMFETSPDTGNAFTSAEIASMQAGAEVVA